MLDLMLEGNGSRLNVIEIREISSTSQAEATHNIINTKVNQTMFHCNSLELKGMTFWSKFEFVIVRYSCTM